MVFTKINFIIWWSQKLMNNNTSRMIALKALLTVDEQDAYSNLVLNNILKGSNLSRVEINFLSALFYGVLERRITLDYIIKSYSKIKFSKISKDVLEILRMGLYQLIYMNKVPKSAAVNESVNLAKIVKKKSATGFINGILRSFIRDDCKFTLPDKNRSFIDYLVIKYSCPSFIIKLWKDAYGIDTTIGILKELSGRPILSARVNSLKIGVEDLASEFKKQGISSKIINLIENSLELSFTGNIESSNLYKSGYFHIQDISSQICCKILDPNPGDKVIDVCAAPGGKTFTIAQLMKNIGEITACDIYDSRLNLIKNSAERLGIKIVNTRNRDAANDESLQNNSFDRVLCDVPCSGLGIIRRKPEIRYKTFKNLKKLYDLQYNILCNSAKLVKSGGRLVYSTCTLNPEENNKIADRFLNENKEFKPMKLKLPEKIIKNDFEPINQHTFFPNINNTDGFFVAGFIKV